MQNNLRIAVAALMLLACSAVDASSEVWMLVRSEFRAPTWYCIYQLQGSTAYMTLPLPPTIPSANYCPPTFVKHN